MVVIVSTVGRDGVVAIVFNDEVEGGKSTRYVENSRPRRPDKSKQTE